MHQGPPLVSFTTRLAFCYAVPGSLGHKLVDARNEESGIVMPTHILDPENGSY